jgi:hypothetical protein
LIEPVIKLINQSRSKQDNKTRVIYDDLNLIISSKLYSNEYTQVNRLIISKLDTLTTLEKEFDTYINLSDSKKDLIEIESLSTEYNVTISYIALS